MKTPRSSKGRFSSVNAKTLKKAAVALLAALAVAVPGAGQLVAQSGAGPADAGTSASSAQSGATFSGADSSVPSNAGSSARIEENGSYTSKEEVAAYLHEFGKLPKNFVSKTKAREAGWDADEGNLDEVLPGKSIGGSVFSNFEGKLPDAKGRVWKECDIDYEGGFRNGKRIVFSNDGLVYYSDDHYRSFERLY